jgi:hypothetical protein
VSFQRGRDSIGTARGIGNASASLDVWNARQSWKRNAPLHSEGIARLNSVPTRQYERGRPRLLADWTRCACLEQLRATCQTRIEREAIKRLRRVRHPDAGFTRQKEHAIKQRLSGRMVRKNLLPRICWLRAVVRQQVVHTFLRRIPVSSDVVALHPAPGA